MRCEGGTPCLKCHSMGKNCAFDRPSAFVPIHEAGGGSPKLGPSTPPSTAQYASAFLARLPAYEQLSTAVPSPIRGGASPSRDVNWRVRDRCLQQNEPPDPRADTHFSIIRHLPNIPPHGPSISTTKVLRVQRPQRAIGRSMLAIRYRSSPRATHFLLSP